MLKILEEPPEYVIFLFATTDPQKIPGTILSRVQRFNFSRISTEGIKNRLTYILNQEGYTDYDPLAVDYLARLAKGGMRDAITTMEKCLDYSPTLTQESVLKVTSGGVNESVLLDLLRKMLNNQSKESILAFNDIYMSGTDTSLFLKLYIEFLQDCVKYLITRYSNIVSLSQTTIEWLEDHPNALSGVRQLLIDAIRIKNEFSSEDLKILIESWIVQECE